MDKFKVAAPQEYGFDTNRLGLIEGFLQTYLDNSKLPNWGLTIMRHGHVLYENWQGTSAFDGGFTPDRHSIYRIYSMTKPITSVGLMMLFEQGKFQLTDPVAKFIPSFKNVTVFDSGTSRDYTVKKPDREMTILDLLTHQSGLTYDFMMDSPVDALYRNNKINGARSEKYDLAEFSDRVAEMPLVFSPGEAWNYSVSTDICGRLIEVISGQSLDVYFKDKILDPLGMHDTMFTIDDARLNRLTHNYNRDPLSGEIQLADSPDRTIYRPGRLFLSGGGGLLSTMNDYARFCEFLRRGGELDGTRLLSPHTLTKMTSNHLPNNETMMQRARGTFSEVSYGGTGFGLGFSVVINPTETPTVSFTGNYSWGGLASTFFWNDPVNQISVIFLTQLMPSGAYPIRPQLQQLVYGALID